MKALRQLSLAVVLASSAPGAARALDFQLCSRCHDGVLAQHLARSYLHSPFGQWQCAACHSATEAQAQAKRVAAVAAQDEGQKINWISEGSAEATAHWYPVPAERMREWLVVEARASGGTVRQQVHVPRLATLPEFRDVGRPPIISGLRVLEIERGLFLTATIAWDTDTVADAMVRYGKGDLKQSSPRGARFGRRHQVTLYDLEPGATYLFSAVSRDLFGRLQTSEPLTFSTARSVAGPRPGASGEVQQGEPKGISVRFLRLGEQYLVEVAAERAASVAIGARGATQRQVRAEQGARVQAQGDDLHAALSSKLAASLDACGNCHQSQGTATHPVNVYPKPGMIIPPEYPRLADGRITCASCHDAHSSNNDFLLIKAGQRELCVGCHRNMK